VYEIRISKSALSNLGSSIGVGYKDVNSSWESVCRIPNGSECFYELLK